MQLPRIRRVSPGRVLLTALATVIFLGTALLSMPFCQRVPLSLFQALFTTVSTVCVTGLQVVPMSSFTPFGHAMILLLMQIGGLGLMTFSFFIASLFLNLGMTSKLMAGQLFEFESWSNIKTFLTIIVLVTLGVEAAGAGALFISFKELMPNDQAFFYAIFHSVSAFCNAGITLFEHSMTAMSGNMYVLGVLSALVFAGGIGFIVWYELAYSIRHMYYWLRNKTCPLFTFSLHTRIALITSSLLILFGTACIWSLEHDHSLRHLTGIKGLANAFFLSISMRSAGFMVTNITTMAPATVLVLLCLMMIGASPGSTGSGIKTTNFALFCASVRSIISNRDAVEIDGRTIPNDQMQKVIAVMTIALSWVLCTTFLLLFLEPHLPFISVFFEAISAFSTCGLTMGITPGLCISSKIISYVWHDCWKNWNAHTCPLTSQAGTKTFISLP